MGQKAAGASPASCLKGRFFVRPEGRFSVPTCPRPVTPCAAAVKDGPLGPPPEAARSVLEGGEHGVTLAVVGTAAIFALIPSFLSLARATRPWQSRSRCQHRRGRR